MTDFDKNKGGYSCSNTQNPQKFSGFADYPPPFKGGGGSDQNVPGRMKSKFFKSADLDMFGDDLKNLTMLAQINKI